MTEQVNTYMKTDGGGAQRRMADQRRDPIAYQGIGYRNTPFHYIDSLAYQEV